MKFRDENNKKMKKKIRRKRNFKGKRNINKIRASIDIKNYRFLFQRKKRLYYKTNIIPKISFLTR